MSGSAAVPMDVPADVALDVALDDLRRDLAGAQTVAPAPGSRSDYSCSSVVASADEVQAAASAADGPDDLAVAGP
jgi:hypothetical protein